MSTAQSFAGRTAVVTGAGTGIGRATAERLASEGAGVVLVGRAAAALEQTLAGIVAAGGTALSVAADVSDAGDVDRVFELAARELGLVDIVVNNAGVYHAASLLDVDRAQWDETLAVGLTGPLLVSRRAARELIAAGRPGAIVNVASIDGHVAEAGSAAHNAAKAGMMLLTKTMALEWGAHGIRANSVSPGLVLTPPLVANFPAGFAEWARGAFERAPLGRALEAEEIAAVCAFLASDDASAVTGTDLIADGGVLANSWILESMPARVLADA